MVRRACLASDLPPPPSLRPRRRDLLWLGGSFVFWAFLAFHLGNSRAALFEYTDHWSHYGDTELFLEHGFDVYRFPPNRYCRPPAPVDARDLPPVVGCAWCSVPELRSRQLCVNWEELRHPYPPGVFLYSLPEVLLLRYTALSYRAINLFSILKFLVVAHLLMWWLWRLLFGAVQEANPWLRVGLFALLWLEIGKWTLSGFYDPVAIAALVLAIWYLWGGRNVDALVALSAAMFLHFRSLWFLPLVGWAAWRVLRRHELRAGATPWVELGAAGAMLGVSAYAFLLVYSGLGLFPPNNAVQLGLWSWSSAAVWNLGVPSLFVLLYLLRGRRWMTLSCAAWQIFMIVRTPQVHEWHALSLLPILPLAAMEGGGGTLVAAVVLYLTEAAVIFYGGLPLPGGHIANLFHLWTS